jgi:hypothetical protein
MAMALGVSMVVAALAAAQVAPFAGGAKADDAAPARDYTLRLGEVSFDPLEGVPDRPAGFAAGRAEGPDLQLVQLEGPTLTDWLDGVRASGAEIVQYIHPYTYVVWCDANARSAMPAQHEFVRWSGEFQNAFKVLPRYRDLGPAPADIRVMIYRGADVDAAIRAITGLGGQNTGRRVMDEVFEHARFTIPGDLLPQVAAVPGVYTVRTVPTDGGLRGEMSNQINVGNYDASNLAFPGYAAWLAGVGLDGSGVIMANVDGGIQDTHPDLTARLLPCTGSTCGGSAQSGHGTHTAGIMAGDGASGTLDSFGFLRGQGVAPGASLIEQVYSPTFTQPGGMLTLMKQSSQNSAVLSGNSWGPSGSPQGYDDDTRQVDVGVRDADDGTPGNQEFSYVLSFMNGNGGTSSQGTPDEAKNLFNIGSTKMQNSGSGTQILDIDDLSSNTAHGPALDGRTIPHMVAPGCYVDSCTTGSGYTLLCGTSMASPHVSGAVGLFFEYWRGQFPAEPDPSPALVKAAFLPVTFDLAGNLDADNGVLGHPFDSKQGWGRMNLEAVVDPPANSVRYWDQQIILDNTGEEWSTTVSPLDPGAPMKIRLVWTDAPGHGLGSSTPAWNNDLYLVVEAGASTYLGNNFDASGWSATGGAADFMNNTEGVFLGPLPPGAATIRVVAANINSDGVPGVGDATDQDFAVACYNCAIDPGFALTVLPNSLDVCAPDDGVFTVEVEQILGFTDPVNLSASGNPAGTTVGFDANPVVPPATVTMTVSGTGSAGPGSSVITVDGASGPIMRSTAGTLNLTTAAAGAVSLTAPPNGATGVGLTPVLEWTAASQAASYAVEIATDAGFTTVIESAIVAETSYPVQTILDTLTTYHWRVQADNACGSGGYSAAFSFQTLDTPPILLVDDDDNGPDVRGTYEATLDALGLLYDVWDTNNTDNEPDAASLAPYSMVIWFTGDEFGGASGPGPGGEAALAGWLDAGSRCLVVISQDYLYDRGLTAFISDYLGVDSYTSDVSQSSVTGTGGIFGGMGPYALSYPFSNWSDRITPDGTAALAFDGSAGDAAVSKSTAAYQTMFWGFPLEAVPAAADREALMQVIIESCAGITADCNGNGRPDYLDLLPGGPSDDVNNNQIPDECECLPDATGDGLVVDVSDLLQVLADWGNAGGPSDVNYDGTVDVSDLLAVLAAWGPCP